MELKKIKIEDIKPYERNPRFNDDAVDAVKKSIEQCEYVSPIVLDENNVILAGHTRYKALKKLGYKEAECVIKEGLTEEQKKKYRLLDNKTNELADWDMDLLSEELEGLDFGDLDLDWGIKKEEDLEEENPYTKSVNLPQYEIKGEAETLENLYDNEKAEQLISEIEESNVTEKEKEFLKAAAYRHYVFNFEKIAEYYAQATSEMQDLMEKSALVIIDYDDAIANGFTALTESLEELIGDDLDDA